MLMIDIALQHLRVCTDNPGQVYNCGRCPKCLRTMVNLRIVGALERCPTFARPLDLKKVAQLDPHTTNGREFLEVCLRGLADPNRDPALAQALQAALNQPFWRSQIIRGLRRVKARLLPRTRFLADASQEG